MHPSAYCTKQINTSWTNISEAKVQCSNMPSCSMFMDWCGIGMFFYCADNAKIHPSECGSCLHEKSKMTSISFRLRYNCPISYPIMYLAVQLFLLLWFLCYSRTTVQWISNHNHIESTLHTCITFFYFYLQLMKSNRRHC